MTPGVPILLRWLATYGAHSTVLLGATLLLTRTGRLGPAASERAWRIGLLGGALTATLAMVFGSPIALFPTAPPEPLASRAPLEPVPETLVETPVRPDVSVTTVSDAPAPATSPSAPESGPDPSLLLLLWPLGALALLFRDHAVRRRLARSFARRVPNVQRAVHDLVASLRREAGLRRPVAVSTSPAIASPVALGVRRLEIVLPERALRELDPAALEAMLAHEVAHLARRDPLWARAYAAATGLLFFQPLNHLARRRLADLAERRADAWAARAEHRRVALARCLTTVAGWIGDRRVPATVPAMAARRASLGVRVQTLLAGPVREASGGRGLALLPLLVVPLLAPARPAAPPELVPPGSASAAGDPRAAALESLEQDLRSLGVEAEDVTRALEAQGHPDLARRIEARVRSIEERTIRVHRALGADGR